MSRRFLSRMAVRNVDELLNLMKDKKSAVKFLQEKGILHAVQSCTNGHDMQLSVTQSRSRWRCHQCPETRELFVGTWLSGCKLTCKQIVLFIYWWSKELTSASFCQSELGISKNCTLKWNKCLREVCANILLGNPVIIGGPNMTVEIDESVFTRRKHAVGRVFPQQWVFGGICRETRECFMTTVPDRSANTLIPIIAQHIRPGTTVISDMWRAYSGVANIPGLIHQTVNHSHNFVDPETGAHTQMIERCWRSAKERNRRQNGTHRHMLQSYFCEFLWRNSVKRRDADTFNSILEDIAQFWPPM